MTKVVEPQPVDLLIDRILNNPSEKVTDPDLAFHLCVLRRWVQRVGVDGPLVEFTTVLDGVKVGWALTRRGRAVADEELLMAGSARAGAEAA